MSTWIRNGSRAVVALVLATTLAAARTGDEHAERLTALVERFKAARSAFSGKLQAAKNAAEQEALWAERPEKEFLPEFRKVALDAQGTETAAKAWVEVYGAAVELRLRNEVTEATTTLLDQHAGSESLAALASRLPRDSYLGKKEILGLLRELSGHATHPQAQAASWFALGTMLAQGREGAAEARTLLARVIEQHGALEAKPGRTWKQRAEGWLFELDHLQIGMTAPDFESIDENGETFRLADYRGKVVVLDFWGMW